MTSSRPPTLAGTIQTVASEFGIQHVLRELSLEGIRPRSLEDLYRLGALDGMTLHGSAKRLEDTLFGIRNRTRVDDGTDHIHLRPVRHTDGSYLEGIMTLFGSPRNRPPRMTLIEGESLARNLTYYPPPRVRLDTHVPLEIMQMLEYAGIHYQSPETDAAKAGVGAFEVGRAFVLKNSKIGFVSFDWDHTLSDYQITSDLIRLILVKLSKTRPAEELSQTSMVALEALRPLMGELAMGMMVGFAMHQGSEFETFDQWEHYKPRVGLASHTWNDRVGLLGQHFMRILPLMHGLLPGTNKMYEKLTSPENRTVMHLQHFLDYAERLMGRIEAKGFQALSDQELREVLGYFKDGAAHYRKPAGAFREQGWTSHGEILHFDDSGRVVEDLQAGHVTHALRVYQPHSQSPRDVRELEKVFVRSLFLSPKVTLLEAGLYLAGVERERSTADALLGALKTFPNPSFPGLSQRNQIPGGTIMQLHETSTTLGRWWDEYVNPSNRLKKLIRRLRRERARALREEQARRQWA